MRRASLRQAGLQISRSCQQDIFTVPLGQLPGTESVMTITGGEIVYSSGGAQGGRLSDIC